MPSTCTCMTIIEGRFYKYFTRNFLPWNTFDAKNLQFTVASCCGWSNQCPSGHHCCVANIVLVILSMYMTQLVDDWTLLLQMPGARELGITSDDVFFLQHPPGKTYVTCTLIYCTVCNTHACIHIYNEYCVCVLSLAGWWSVLAVSFMYVCKGVPCSEWL